MLISRRFGWRPVCPCLRCLCCKPATPAKVCFATGRRQILVLTSTTVMPFSGLACLRWWLGCMVGSRSLFRFAKCLSAQRVNLHPHRLRHQSSKVSTLYAFIQYRDQQKFRIFRRPARPANQLHRTRHARGICTRRAQRCRWSLQTGQTWSACLPSSRRI